ncbi:MAG: M3 family peptidase [Bacteroidetes bacterium]|nr:MAG: M3 family peptidase [Bacteroidota bacterium]
MKTKNNLLTLMIILTLAACSTDQTNPLLQPFDTPFETPPFHLIRHEHYVPAFKAAIEQARREIDSIAQQEVIPDFQNTIEALSRAGNRLDLISGIFYNVNHAETDETMQQIARDVSPLMTDYSNDILFNAELFARVNQVYNQRQNLNLTPEQNMLLEKTWKSFARNGANLSGEQKEQMRKISRELSELSLQFNDNVLAETNGWFLHVTDENDLSGLPVSTKDAAAEAARAKNLEGWVITLHGPSFVSFMRYADKRNLREKVYMAYAKRGYQQNEHNNTEILTRIANLRLERARLLGYPSHADFVLEETMAQSANTVNDFLKELADASLPVARKELKEVQQFASANGGKDEIQPWDWSYYAEKLRQARYDFDEELTRPYFQLEKVTEGIFDLTHKLWGFTYRQNTEIPVYHKDVEVYEVYDADGSFLSLLYMDFFPREGKSGGAWMTSFREQYRKDGQDFRPQVSIVCNFSKPTDTSPSLLTFNEFSTYLHEFGHALHGMMSQVTYGDLSGTSVYRDFVELPSQILENWAVEKEFLDLFARHYQTGEPMPGEMVKKIIEVKNFHAAYATVRQLSFGLNDMAWHSITDPVTMDAEKFERKAMEPVQLFGWIDGTMMSTAFSHIFSGGYAAGYYGYKWAEVLDADAYKLFKENGIFDKKTAQSFRENILAKGGSEHPMDLYVKFRGHEPSIDALLERSGLK